MLNQKNLIIDANVARLDSPLPPMRARVGASFVADIRNVPADCSDLVLRVSVEGGAAFHDFPATCSPNGDWDCRILGVAFRKAGASEWYEVRAKDARGDETAIGRGSVLVFEWSAGTAKTYDARKRFVTTIFDEQGSQHAIWAVKNDIGEWTYQIGPVGDAEAAPADTVPASNDARVYITAIDEE